MELQDNKKKIVVPRFCATCGGTFVELERCPNDNSLLCPVETDVLIGTTVGHYMIVEKIGSGSHSTVYKAHHKDINRTVAIKVLHCHLRNEPVNVSRFQLEAESTAKLAHSSISAMYDFGLLDDGRPYIVMELVSGRSLSELISRKELPDTKSLIALFQQVSEALLAAHTGGIVHRDITPGNIMLDDNGTAKIVDFGLAKILTDELPATVTRTGDSVGTPAYMSPEQCQGLALDARSDLYSLGCVMYECLAGQPVFSSTTSFACMYSHVSARPKDLSELVKDSLAKNMAPVVMRCLEKDPANRYESLAKLRDDIRRILAGEQVKPAPKGSRAAGFFWVFAGTFALVVLIFINLAVFLPKESPTEEPSQTTTIPAEVEPVSPASPPFKVEVPADAFNSDSYKQLMAYFKHLEVRIDTLRNEGEQDKAKAAEDELRKFKQLLTGKYSPPTKMPYEIHGVGLYRNVGNGPVRVDITYTSNPVILILSGPPQTWQIRVAPGVKIAQVLWLGAKPPTIEGLPAGVPAASLGGSVDASPHNHIWTHVLNEDLNQLIMRRFGQEVSTFTSRYDATTSPFLVGPESPDWRAQHILWRMKKFYDDLLSTAGLGGVKGKIGNIEFPVVWDRAGQSSVGFCTVLGPRADTLTNVPSEYRAVAFDPKSKTYYVSDTHSVGVLNRKTGQVLALKAPERLLKEDLSSIGAIAFDTRRERLMVFSTYSDSFFEFTHGTWTKLGGQRNFQVASMCYSKQDDAFYGVGPNYQTPGGPSIFKLNSNGVVLKALSDQGLRAFEDKITQSSYVQICDVGSYLIMIIADPFDSSDEGKQIVLDKNSGIPLLIEDLPEAK